MSQDNVTAVAARQEVHTNACVLHRTLHMGDERYCQCNLSAKNAPTRCYTLEVGCLQQMSIQGRAAQES